jgi:hypothetical protein
VGVRVGDVTREHERSGGRNGDLGRLICVLIEGLSRVAVMWVRATKPSGNQCLEKFWKETVVQTGTLPFIAVTW